MDIDRGSRLGPYEVVSRIGAGGMGVVWQGRDTRLDRPVAIKVLPAEYSANAQFRLRFEREARAISSLNHPHICTLFDVGEGYLVMELLDGESLAERLRKGPLPLDQVLRYGAQIAQALEAAHRQGIVHRDLKPGNVVLTRGGAKLLDFGLAKSASIVSAVSQVGDAAGADATEHRALTQEGTLLGTFQYMAPEQLEGVEADARTDIFALGALLYEMATGRRAFEGASKTSLIAAIVAADPPPISSINPITPPALDHIVKRCLQKAPEERWQSAHDVAGELLWIGEAGSQAGVPATRTARRRTRERLAWGLAAALLVVAGALASWAVGHVRNPPRPFRTAVMPPDGVRVPLFDETPGNAVPAPDGTKIVYRGVEGRGSASLYVHDLITGEVRVLPESADAQYPFWSPDSRWVGFFTQRNGSLLKIDTAGGTPIRVAAAINGKGGSWNEKGEIVFTPDFGSAISVVSANGGAVREVTRLDVALHNSHRHPRFLPDGRRFLFLARSIQPGQESSVMLGSLDGAEPREILKSRTQAEYAAGALLFARGSTLMTQRFDASKGALAGEAQPLAEGVVTFGGASLAAIAAAGEQFVVYHTTKTAEIRPLEWRDRKGERAGTIPIAGDLRNAAVSPSGRFIAVSLSSPDGDTDVWILDSEGGVARRLPSPGEDLMPAWSRDETTIVFSSNPKGRFGVYRRSIESGAAAETVLESKDDLFVTSALPDGSGFLITRGTARPSAGTPASTVDLLKSGANELTPAIENALLAAVSRDGRWVAWSVPTADGADLFVATWPALSGRRQIANRISNLFWGARGSELLYADLEDKLFSMTIDPPSPPREVPVTGLPLAASPDGNRILTLAAPTELPTSTIRMIQNWQRNP
jgi:eukaryotic-like serine/threonine-protein kinase